MNQDLQPNLDGIIKPPNRWRSKITGIAGPPDPDLLKKVNERIAKVAASYKQWAEKDVDELQAKVKQLDTAKDEQKQQLLKEVFTSALEIRGQGGCFGYPLVSEIAKSLCIFVDAVQKLEVVDHTAQEICHAHAQAIKLALAKDGSAIETLDKKVVAGLNKAAQVYAKRREIELAY